MKPFVRRSHLIADPLDAQAVSQSWQLGADAIILDLTAADTHADRRDARAALEEATFTASLGGAEVFARVNRIGARADIDAAIRPGISGIVCAADDGGDVAAIDAQFAELETRRGIEDGSLQIIALLDSAAGVWNIRRIVQASARVSSVGIDEPSLCAQMGIEPNEALDAFEYAKGRVVIESRAWGAQPIGLAHPCGMLPGAAASDDDRRRLALRSKNLGFAGAICPNETWVSACNAAFAPDPSRLDFYRETRRLFAEGVARGTAAIPYPGTTMMIDVPVDENARVNLELWELCETREAQKAAAVKAAKARTGESR